ncbi:Leucine-rich repeat (LRR) protein [Flavobacterium nitrogenifigens]|uniref:Leucine-rich repeat (LRR) protein n=2 Tax=Flavobacterium TaxID=237 RepID=A0A7W7N9W7_9FLAO|nr:MULTISPECIES: leucine-rich repeat domain-containing protein [Flavobacterium]MBB4803956.1 Leucine-rich repeat (LRR) protein [Flavobacterium nitrogenifigens]MBB6388892.1 Leucine-rich repeat (LRR) protein [Flavobacterium notoginsengisoli]
MKDKGEIFSQFVNLEVLEIQTNTSMYYLNDFELPVEIGNLKKLKKISVLNFPLQTFPEWLFNIKSLEYLMLRGNDMEIIPESISRLENLETLRIESCPLSKIPKALIQLKKLRFLGLCDTRLTDLNYNLFPYNLKEINFSGTGIYKDEDLELLKIKMPKTRIYP